MKLCIQFFPKIKVSRNNRFITTRIYHALLNGSYYKQNPRDMMYMQFLVKESFKNKFIIIDINKMSPSLIKGATEVILLWPDSLGHGWFNIEKKIFIWKKKNTRVMVLNGRRRYFSLSKNLWLKYLILRAIEKFWLGEVLFFIVFLFLTPFLILYDSIKGHW
jgi:hypothetical protein